MTYMRYPGRCFSLLPHLPRSQTHAAAVLGVHGGETDMGIYCTFQLSIGDRPSDSAGGDAGLTCRSLIGHLLSNLWETRLLVMVMFASVVVFLRCGTLLSFFFCLLGASSPLSSVGLVWKKKRENWTWSKTKTNKRNRILSRKENIRNEAWITVWETVKCLAITLFDTYKLKIYFSLIITKVDYTEIYIETAVTCRQRNKSKHNNSIASFELLFLLLFLLNTNTKNKPCLRSLC